MSDTTLTMGSNSSLTISGGGTQVGLVGASTVTFSPISTSETFSITVVPGSSVGFIGSFSLPSVPSMTFSPTVVALSNGQYVFTVADLASGTPALTGSCNLIFTTAPGGLTLTGVQDEMFKHHKHHKHHTTTCDPTMIFEPPGT